MYHQEIKKLREAANEVMDEKVRAMLARTGARIARRASRRQSVLKCPLFREGGKRECHNAR